MNVKACVYACVWRPEVDRRCRLPSLLSFETESVNRPKFKDLARLISYQATGIFLSLPPQCWNYRPVHYVWLYMGIGDSNSEPHV